VTQPCAGKKWGCLGAYFATLSYSAGNVQEAEKLLIGYLNFILKQLQKDITRTEYALRISETADIDAPVENLNNQGYIHH
jgi:hypothetical protein